MSLERVREEPFRVLFPLGGLLGCVAILPWALFGLDLGGAYPGELHRTIMTRAFLMCFALGFLLTAIPRRTSSSAASWRVVGSAVLLPVLVTVAAFAHREVGVELAYACMHLLLMGFAATRFVGSRAGRRPPASFVLVPIGALVGLVSALWLASGPAPGSLSWVVAHRMIEQGVFLCWFVGVSGMFLPLISGRPAPADLGQDRREAWRAIAYAVVGLVILGSLALGARGSVTVAPVARGVAVALAFALGAGAWRPPARPGAQRTLLWIAIWCAPVGLIASGLWSTYRADLLHLAFIGSFSLGSLAVATHVTLGHLGREDLASGRPIAVLVLGFGVLMAAATRVIAPLTHSFVLHLGIAACFWLLGAFTWLLFVGRELITAARAEGTG